jgi:predicted SAM-dependent methyltransferase
MKYKDKIANVGCGEAVMRGDLFVNVDIRQRNGIDVMADARKLPFEDGELGGVMSRNLIEHFGRHEVMDVMREWVRVVKPEGYIRVETIDMGKLMDKWRELPTDLLLDGAMGAQTYPENFHKMLFTRDILEKLFDQAGLSIIKVEQFENRGIPRIIVVGHKLYERVGTQGDRN